MSDTGHTLDLSVVVPVYDEKENLERLVEELEQALQTLGLRHEILLLDDGSRDGSSELIASMARSQEAVRGLYFRENAGQTAALDAGFKHARGRFVVTLDADLQNDPADIASLLDESAKSGSMGSRGGTTRRRPEAARPPGASVW